MRGKAARTFINNNIIGITPAYAGKSVRCTVSCKCSRDHPRLCGEKLKTAVKDGVYTGSPPPMRGKVWVSVSFGFTTRITPAYAGKSWVSFGGSGGAWDHPRLCGEKLAEKARVRLEEGSPPPMRGKDVFRGIDENNFRITPAYAGKSL